MISQEERVAGAIMRAFFSRPLDLQYINVSVDDQADLARAAIEAIETSRESGVRERPSPWDSVVYQKLRAMPSSLNDACRTMEAAADEIDRLYAERCSPSVSKGDASCRNGRRGQ